ncbi:hypothetical protein LTR17_027721, partial [Elasticomyces elasticus]
TPSHNNKMPPEAYEGPELQFVVTTNLGQSNTAANRKRVRSQAALQSWTERHKRNFEQLEDSGTGREAFRVVTPALLATPTSMAQALNGRLWPNRVPARSLLFSIPVFFPHQLPRPRIWLRSTLRSAAKMLKSCESAKRPPNSHVDAGKVFRSDT